MWKSLSSLAILGVIATVAVPALAQTGPDSYQTFVGAPTYTGLNRPGAVLPSSNGSEGEPDSLNSLPVGALNGTPAMQRHQELEAYWHGESNPSAKLAAR